MKNIPTLLEASLDGSSEISRTSKNRTGDVKFRLIIYLFEDLI